MIRVVLADDQALVRGGLRAILNEEDDIAVVAEAGDGAQAVARTAELRPDVTLLDIKMPGMDGLAAARRILQDPSCTTTKVVLLSTFDLDEYVYEALRLGASGFLLKDSDPRELIHGVRVVARGDAMLAPRITSRLISEFAKRPAKPSRTFDGLTQREREVFGKVAEGQSNEEIATELHLSPATVKTHVSRILTKLGARDRVQLVVLAHTS